MVIMKKNNKTDQKFLTHQKVGIFIDAENIEMSGYNIHGDRTNYKKLVEAIGGVRQIIRIIYYKPIHKEISDDFKKFWAELGGEIKQPEKNADSWITIDAVTLSEKLDVAILVSGDKDYLPLIWYLKSRGCKVEVWSYPETTAALLREAADYFFAMDDSFIIRDLSRKAQVRGPRGRLKPVKGDR
jgi:uncharacterized LabA/DUF88 family protein